MVPATDSLNTMTASVEASSDCSNLSNDQAAIEQCTKGPADEAGNSLSYSEDEEAAITSKMDEVSTHFHQRLRFYQLKEYERLGIEPPEVLLDESNIVSTIILFSGLTVQFIIDNSIMSCRGFQEYSKSE